MPTWAASPPSAQATPRLKARAAFCGVWAHARQAEGERREHGMCAGSRRRLAFLLSRAMKRSSSWLFDDHEPSASEFGIVTKLSFACARVHLFI